MNIAKRAWKMATVGLILALISACSNDVGYLRKKYLDAIYPGHDLPPKERRAASENWGKSFHTLE